MPTGIYKRTEKHKKGWFKKGHISWLKNTKGLIRANKGSFTKGEHSSPETEFKKGQKCFFSKSHRDKISDSLMGNANGNIGSSHHKWKGGVTSINDCQRRKFMESVRKKVLERDNYTCQLCGERGVILQVDHIQPWSEYVELRFNIENCRTLCQKCHYKVTFGKPMSLSANKWGLNFKSSSRREVI